MLGDLVTFPELLLWLPIIGGVFAFMIKDQKNVRNWSLFISLLTLAVSVTSLFFQEYDPNIPNYNNVSYVWMKYIGSSFWLGLDGMGHLLTFLTAIAFPLIIGTTYKQQYDRPNAFYGLLLLSQAGLMGVFVAMDALVFYFFWELALIPVYFLSSMWGGEKRIQATFKFFIYTFVASLIMLIGILYVYQHTSPTSTADHSFALRSFYNVELSAAEQGWLFWLFFVAFAVKMPIFPFHTWQPDAYEQSPYPVTMVLSGVMVKMGVFAMIRWVLPIFPDAVHRFDNIVIAISVFGMLYASCIAIVQNDLKRFVAYSSIAHIGLMAASLFAANELSLQGVMIQMFNHGINIIGLWIIIDIIEKKTGVRKISELGGLAIKAPVLSIFLVIIALANIGLPLTNGFIGEFAMFAGLFKFNAWFAAFAGLSIILAAVYMLSMIQKVFLGTPSSDAEISSSGDVTIAPSGEVVLTPVAKIGVTDIGIASRIILSVIVCIILVLGLFPKPIIEMVSNTVAMVQRMGW